MNLFDLILSPFIFIIEQVFLYGYAISGNYGLSIIFLSLIVSLLLLPVFILIEKAKKRDDIVKAKMKPLLDEIKRCYKGQERFYYIKTINRQHNYSAVRSLIPVLSLLLQIPFFIAAYQFLDNFEPLQGVSFGPIQDLSKPDGLLGMVNVLPIVMTVVNILTAYFYTKNGDKKELKQMFVVAGIFLVLLYNLPAGLVLYWTMNNVFSFLRLFVTNPEVFRKLKKEKIEKKSDTLSLKETLLSYKRTISIIFYTVTGVVVLSQLNWAFLNNFDDIVPRLFMALGAGIAVTILSLVGILAYKKYGAIFSKIKINPKIFYSLLFLSIYFHLAAIFYFTGENIELNYFALTLLIPTQFIAFIYFLRAKKSISKILYSTGLFLIIVLFLSQIFNLIVFLTGYPIKLSFFNLKIVVADSTLSDFITSTIIFILISTPFYFIQNRVKTAKQSRSNWLIFALSLIYILGLIFFWNPILVFSSHAEMFEFPAINILTNNFDIFIISALILTAVYTFLSKKFKNMLLFVMLLFTIVSFVYSLVIPINLGSLQVSRFAEHEKLAMQPFYYILEGVLLIAITLAIRWVLNKKYYKQITIGLFLLNIFLIGQTLYSVTKTGHLFDNEKLALSNQNENLESQNKTLALSFSKEKQNVLYYIFDGFQGIFAQHIFEENPALKELFSGFVYYPNTISMSNYTHSSMPSLFAGYDYSVENINSDKTITISETVTKASTDFVSKIVENGFDFTGSWMPYSKIDKSIFKSYIPTWHKSWDAISENLDQTRSSEIWYKRLWENALFYSVPLCFKPVIYNDTKWLSGVAYSNNHIAPEPKYNFVQLRPYISNTESENPSFIYIHGTSAHNPWNIIDERGSFVKDVTPYENNRWILEQFGEWISWMKKNDVYDNTKIILISDHGASWDQYDGAMPFDIARTIDEKDPKKVKSEVFWRLNPLLMVKDYNAKGILKEDWRLMCNADSPSIVFDENDPTKDSNAKDRILSTSFTAWSGEIGKKKEMKILYQYDVSGNIFDLKNWKRVK